MKTTDSHNIWLSMCPVGGAVTRPQNHTKMQNPPYLLFVRVRRMRHKQREMELQDMAGMKLLKLWRPGFKNDNFWSPKTPNPCGRTE